MRASASPLFELLLLLRVVGYLPDAHNAATSGHDLRAGVAQASREETAASATAGV